MFLKKNYTGKLGNTQYTLRQSNSSDILELVRVNSEGTKIMYFPAALLDEVIKDGAKDLLIKKVFGP